MLMTYAIPGDDTKNDADGDGYAKMNHDDDGHGQDELRPRGMAAMIAQQS